MRRKSSKIILTLFIGTIIILNGINSYAHSGRTDANGGHKDNKNVSGLGPYHYHCGGHPAHLHTNGVCPYSSSAGSSSSSSNQKASSNKSSAPKTTTTKPASIDVTEIKINESIVSMQKGETKVLTATITPSNATDKNVTWKSSDESIALINSNGEITAMRAGTVDITATSSNGKTNTIKIKVEDKAEENSNKANTSLSDKNNLNNVESNKDNEEDLSPVGIISTLGLLGGGGYLGYKKYKK